MSGSPDGDAAGRQRSASPTKRSASLMENGERQEVHTEGKAEDALPPPYSAVANDHDQVQTNGTGTELSLDEQVAEITQLSLRPISENERGFVISYGWLSRVFARAPTRSKEGDYPKEALEGAIGPVDNLSIVEDGAFEDQETMLKSFHTQGEQEPFIPLKAGLASGQQYEVLPEEAWNKVVAWYGIAAGQRPITRYAHDTAPQGAAQRNIIFETYPPVFTIRRMPSSSSGATSPPTAASTTPSTPNSSAESVVRVVASRTERFQSFLARSKKAAGIPLKHKVQIFRQLDPAEVASEQPSTVTSAMLTPETSRGTSPSVAVSEPRSKLLLEPSVFQTWEEGTDYEIVDAKDETNNEKYNGKATLDTLGLVNNQTLILEEQIRGPAGGEFASDSRRQKKTLETPKTNGAIRASPASSGPVTRARTKKNGRARGSIGLTNLGNTCYMNSALQCISRVEELAVYFLDGKFKREINTDNPLGHNGRMAKAYAGLLEGLYSANSTAAFRPGQFKSSLAMAQPMFSGYGQQDSQEFLSFLVDALHEDLNRILKKPYRENPDSDDDKVHDPEYIKALGQTYQDNHRARNDSIAMDLFNGFYKNTMICPECEKYSVTFDPYSLITLQLPIENTWQGQVILVPNEGHPVQYNVDMDKNASLRSMKDFIASKVPGLTRNRLIFAEAFGHKIYKMFPDSDTIAESNFQRNDVLVMYELPEAPTNTEYTPKKVRGYRSMLSSTPDEALPDMESQYAERMAIPVFHCKGEARPASLNLELEPTFVLVTREEAKDYDAVLRKVLGAVASLTSRDFLHEFSQDQPLGPNKLARNVNPGNAEGRITDNSSPSEDGYVDVSVQDEEAPADAQVTTDGPTKNGADGTFLQSDGYISPAFRSLFEMKYITGNGEMFCTGSATLGHARPMESRVPQHFVRRGSIESIKSSTSDASRTSEASGRDQSSSESEEGVDTPDLVIGGEEDNFAGDVHSDDELAGPNNINPKQQRRRKFQKGQNRQKVTTYSRKGVGRRGSKQSIRSNVSRASKKTPPPTTAEDPYYIKLGEGIVLDWHDEAFEALFGSDGRSSDDMRGSFTLEKERIQTADDPSLTAKLQRRNQRRKDGVHLEDCFAETSKTEILSEENAWYCNRCKELRRASKTLEIWTAPEVLVLHLKRFSGERYRRDKVDVFVDAPVEGLDLTKRIGCKEDGKEYIYDLFAVDNHYGGLGGGHYTAYAKNFYDGNWYDYNDSSVHQVQPDQVVTTAAYLLFYRRRSTHPLGPPYLRDLVEKSHLASAEASDDDSSTLLSGEGQRLGDRSSHSSPLPGSSSAGTTTTAATATAAAPTRNTTAPPAPPGALAGLPGSYPSGHAANSRAEVRMHTRQLPGSDEDEGVDMGMDDDEDLDQGIAGSGGVHYGSHQSGPLTNPGAGWDFSNVDAHGVTGTDEDDASNHAGYGSDDEEGGSPASDSSAAAAARMSRYDVSSEGEGEEQYTDAPMAYAPDASSGGDGEWQGGAADDDEDLFAAGETDDEEAAQSGERIVSLVDSDGDADADTETKPVVRGAAASGSGSNTGTDADTELTFEDVKLA